MVQLGVNVEQAKPTPWVNLITIVRKPGKTRVCLDPTKRNKQILWGPYPTRTIKEDVANTCEAKLFSVLDANSGYWQLELDGSCSKVCTFNTPWSFIEELNQVFEGIKGVNVITDDIRQQMKEFRL